MRTPPLCELWQLTQTGPGTYSIAELADFNEAIDMQEEHERRVAAARPKDPT